MSAIDLTQPTAATQGLRTTEASWHFEVSVPIVGSPERVFARLDDQLRLAGHMEKSSWMMGGA